MNKKHAEEILKALADWFAAGATGPTAHSQILDDDRSLQQHIADALAGKQ